MLIAPKAGVSGYEQQVIPYLERIFAPYNLKISTDFMGNCYLEKDGLSGKQTVMLAAHLDEIGLITTHIDSRGFVHFSTVGGIDQRVLLNQEVIIHGKKEIKGIICADNPGSNANKKAISTEDLMIDIGYPFTKAQELVQPGDIISINRSPIEILNKRIAGKALDDRAGIAVLAVCINELSYLQHSHKVIAVATVQEEVGLRGAVTSSDNLRPEIAVVIDVTHAQTLDTKNQVNTLLGKGPVIALGPNIHPRIYSSLKNAAEENRIPYQIQPIAGPTGTDARAIQLTGCGIPTGLLSIPLRYMHTSVETVSLQDIVDGGKLLARFIASLPDDLEELSCY
ncbi:MAG TPA: M42 family metallopeptidase [Peptococcaceae bacterium]|nr:M42 family metallopeptidase [Peptococcaceae bacterium]